jgi:hypothetical protein
MNQYICIGMAHGSFMMWNFNTSQPERDSLFQAVHIITETDPETHGFYKFRSAKSKPSVNLRVLANGLLCPLVGTR